MAEATVGFEDIKGSLFGGTGGLLAEVFMEDHCIQGVDYFF